METNLLLDKTVDQSSAENIRQWSQTILKKARISDLTKEYRNIKDWAPANLDMSICARNEAKNRYRDILCADNTRVILKDRDEANDYINASWMITPSGQRFITTQGPLKNTLEDFWHMIFTEKSKVIVMLCQYIEDDMEKARKYFNDLEATEYGVYRVSVKEPQVELYSPVKCTVLQVDKKNSKESLIVYHYHYYDWNDHIAPIDPAPLTNLYRQATAHSKGDPITVHCSAGVGRTSTFVGIPYAVDMIKKNSNVEIVDVLKELRKMRHRSVQSQLQYVFIYISLLSIFIEDKLIPKSQEYVQLHKKYEGIIKKVSKAMEEEKKKCKDRKEQKSRESKGSKEASKEIRPDASKEMKPVSKDRRDRQREMIAAMNKNLKMQQQKSPNAKMSESSRLSKRKFITMSSPYN